MQNLTATLTERETEVYYLMLQGLGNQKIADILSISLGGTKFHVSNIFLKLGVCTRAAVVAYGAGSRELGEVLIGDGSAYSEAQIRQAAAVLIELGLGNRKEVNETIINLLGVLGGKIK